MDERNQVLPGFTVSDFGFGADEDFCEVVDLRTNRGTSGAGDCALRPGSKVLGFKAGLL